MLIWIVIKSESDFILREWTVQYLLMTIGYLYC